MKVDVRSGFSLVELMVALVILTAGMLAMASASGYSSIAVRMAGSRTQRAFAVGSVLESLRTRTMQDSAWQNLASVDSAHGFTVDGYRIWYDVSTPATGSKRVLFYSSGRSYIAGAGWKTGVRERFTMDIAEPFPIP